jgi:hypothetical protein
MEMLCENMGLIEKIWINQRSRQEKSGERPVGCGIFETTNEILWPNP